MTISLGAGRKLLDLHAGLRPRVRFQQVQLERIEQGELFIALEQHVELLPSCLLFAVEEHPEILGDVGVPDDASEFKSTYPEVLPRFEARRADSPHRSDIARTVVGAAASAMVMEPVTIRRKYIWDHKKRSFNCT